MALNHLSTLPKKLVSFVIPSLNESKTVISCLENLCNALSNSHTGIDFEIIWVDNGSTDKTLQLAKGFLEQNYHNYRVISEPQRGVSIARNSGAKVANGDWLCFLDADNLVSTNFILKVIECVEQDVDMATIRTLASRSKLLGLLVFSVLEIFKTFLPRKFGKSLVKKIWYSKVGGFNESIELGENVEFHLKLSKLSQQNSKMTRKHIRASIITSTRRFENHGYFPTLFVWFVAYLGYFGQKYQPINVDKTDSDNVDKTDSDNIDKHSSEGQFVS